MKKIIIGLIIIGTILMLSGSLNAEQWGWQEGQILTIDEFLNLNEGELNSITHGNQAIVGEWSSTNQFGVTYTSYGIATYNTTHYIIAPMNIETTQEKRYIELCNRNSQSCYNRLINSNQEYDWEGVHIKSCKIQKDDILDELVDIYLEKILRMNEQYLIQTFLEEGEPEL